MQINKKINRRYLDCIWLIILVLWTLVNKGVYISKQLRMGRSIIIPKLGVFTFSVPETTLTVCFFFFFCEISKKGSH